MHLQASITNCLTVCCCWHLLTVPCGMVSAGSEVRRWPLVPTIAMPITIGWARSFYKGMTTIPSCWKIPLHLPTPLQIMWWWAISLLLPSEMVRAYGLEWFIQQKSKRDYWWMVSYTYSVSEFQDKNGEYRPAVWDSRHFISLTAGKTWKNGWQVGGRWLLQQWHTLYPYDSVASSLISNWEWPIAEYSIIIS